MGAATLWWPHRSRQTGLVLRLKWTDSVPSLRGQEGGVCVWHNCPFHLRGYRFKSTKVTPRTVGRCKQDGQKCEKWQHLPAFLETDTQASTIIIVIMVKLCAYVVIFFTGSE